MRVDERVTAEAEAQDEQRLRTVVQPQAVRVPLAKQPCEPLLVAHAGGRGGDTDDPTPAVGTVGCAAVGFVDAQRLERDRCEERRS